MSEISLNFFFKKFFLKTTGGFSSVMDTFGGVLRKIEFKVGVQQIIELF